VDWTAYRWYYRLSGIVLLI